MPIKLGVYAPKSALSRLRELSAQFEGRCELVFMAYSGIRSLCDNHRQWSRFMDGVVFDSPTYYRSLVRREGEVSMPHVCLDVTEEDLCRSLFVQHQKNPELDLRRVLVGIDSGTHPLDPATLSYLPAAILVQKPYDRTEELIARYRRHWLKGSYDLLITSHQELISSLTSMGIRAAGVRPSQASIRRHVEELLCAAALDRIEKNQVVCGLVEPDAENGEGAQETGALWRFLDEFNRRHQMSIAISKNGNQFELVTSGRTLEQVTAKLTECHLSEFLKFNLQTPVCIGWGAANNLIQARINARRAFRESQLDKRHQTYAVCGANDIVGPLTGDSSAAAYRIRGGNEDAALTQAAERTGVSALTLKRISAVIERLGRNELSSEELGYSLGIEARSARRILAKLEAGGAARLVSRQQLNLRGRPAKIYRLQF